MQTDNASTYSLAGIILQIIPFIIIVVPFIVINGIVAAKKGKSVIKYVLLSLIPFVSFYLTIWLLSLTDKKVLDELESIEEKLSMFEVQHGTK